MTKVIVNGREYSDDGTSPRDMSNSGHRTYLLPMIADTMAALAGVDDAASEASGSASAAAASASAAADSESSAAQSASDASQSAASVANLGKLRRYPVSANYTVGIENAGGLIDCTGIVTLSFAAAATLGNGWFAYVRNSGSGTITLDPSGSEAIDGAATLVIRPGEVRLVQYDGAALRTVTLDRGAAGVLHLQNQAASGSSPSQGLSQGAQTTVAFNTVVTNTLTGASLASNLIALPAGTYGVRFSASSGYSIKPSLRNITGGVTLLFGIVNQAQGTMTLDGQFTLTTPSQVAIQVYTGQSGVSIGSAGANDGNPNVGVNLVIERVA